MRKDTETKAESTALAISADDENLRELLLQGAPASYAAGVRCFLGYLEGKDRGLSLEALAGFGEYLREERGGRRYSARTINQYLAAVINRIHHLVERRQGTMNAAELYALEKSLKDLKREKIASAPIGEEKILTYTEIRQLISECPKPDVALFMEFLSLSALRVSEMTGILLSDLFPGRTFVTIRIRGKGGKERQVRMEPELIERIRKHFAGGKYLFEHHGRRYTRELISMRIRRTGWAILGRRISAHTFRHSWATAALKKSGRTKAVQLQLGHSSSSTTIDLYVHDRFSWKEQGDLFR